ncbi:MAG: DNA recombination protein RmuC [Patescibacteria group bacterium]
MTTILVLAAVVLIVMIGTVYYELLKQRKARASDDGDSALMQWLKDFKEDQRHASRGSQEASKEIGQRLDKAAGVIAELNKEVGRIQKMGQSIEEMREVFRSPKLRGNVGESLMKDILSECLPKAKFKLQHTFKSGEKVDAVVLTSSGMIPIDSKFPLEKWLAAQKVKGGDGRAPLLREFHQQVKKHVTDIAKKYILPGEDTVDYAFMYVPGEAVFQEIYADTDLYDFAAAKHVILVSPNNFYLFLQLVLKSFEGEQIEARAKEVLAELRAIQQDSGKLGGSLDLLFKHLGNASKSADSVTKDFDRMKGKIDKAGSLSGKQAETAERLEQFAKLPEEPVGEADAKADAKPAKRS